MKQPAIQFYTGDWFKDADLSLCGAATRGIWIDLLFRMHDRDRCGQLVGTRKGLAQLGRCTEPELDAALLELSQTKTATVTDRHGEITVTNRRMRRDWEDRQEAAKRAKNYRNRHRTEGDAEESRPEYTERNGENHAEVTLSSSSSSSFSSSEEREKSAREPSGFSPPSRSQEAVALASQARQSTGPTQADYDRARKVAALYPDKASKDNRPIGFSLSAQNLLAVRIAANPHYPWEDHATLCRTIPTPQDGQKWAEDMPNPVALEKLRKATKPAEKKGYYVA